MKSGAPASIHSLRQILAPLNGTQRRSAAGLVCLMVVGVVLEMLSVGLIVPVLAVLIQPADGAPPAFLNDLPWYRDLDQAQRIQAALAGLVLVYAVKNVFLACLAWVQARFSFNVQVSLAGRLLRSYLEQPYSFHLRRNSAQLISNVTREVDVFTAYCITPSMLVLSEGLILFALTLLLIVVEPVGAGVVITIFAGATWGFHRLTRRPIARWGAVRQENERLRLQHLQQGLGGVKDVKLLGREDHMLGLFGNSNSNGARAIRFQTVLQQLPRLWLEMLAMTSLAAVVFSMLAQGRSLSVIVPTLGLFAAAAFRLMPSASRLISSFQSIRYGMPAAEALNEELRLDNQDRPEHAGNDVPGRFKFSGQIRLEDVSYRYEDAEAFALRDIGLVIRKGEMIGIVGTSGSGKSTLVDLILGLLHPTSGRILVDGENVAPRLRQWQRQVGYVPQAIFLADDSLRRNIAFGLPDDAIDAVAVDRAVRAARLQDVVDGLPQGLDTLVGERGVRLSGGQRQRIAIARALYLDPQILVLDEATSALDAETERSVMEAVAALHGAKTIIVIAHRLSTVESCDRLYRVERGSLSEERLDERFQEVH